MRIHRLDLIRYGHFTDKSLELPKGDLDLHLIVGPNEAGKSTALAGLGDFLFGIQTRSAFDFKHDYKSMRLGAVLEAGNTRLELRRRKGQYTTLLDENNQRISEDALRPFLNGANREFFERMFSLDHVRLRRGGKEILDAKDEVGAMLFSAGSAVQDLRGRLRGLEEEAEKLWAPRRSEKKEYFQAASRLDQADQALREHRLTATAWKEREEELGRCEKRYAELESQVENKRAELRKLARIRRVAGIVRKKTEMDTAIRALGPVANIPKGARQDLDKAQENERFANLRIAEEGTKLERARKEMRSIVCDEKILRLEDRFKSLREQRITVRAERNDLPKREADLEALEKKLRDLACEFGWQDLPESSLASLIPSAGQCNTVRRLLDHRSSQLAAAEAATAALQEAEEHSESIQRQINETGENPETGPLAALIATAKRNATHVESKIREAELAAADAESDSERHLAQLHPRPDSVDAACSIRVPSTESVQQARDTWSDCEKRLAKCRDRLRQAKLDLNLKRTKRDTIRDTEQPISTEELEQLREQRDHGWSLIRGRYIRKETVADEDLISFTSSFGDAVAAYEDSVREADHAADKRFDRAEATARFSQASQSATVAERHLADLKEEVRELEEEFAALNGSWCELWKSAPFEPEPPTEMLVWLATQAKLSSSEHRRKKALRDEAAYREQEAEVIQQIRRKLKEIGMDVGSLDSFGLDAVIEYASGVVAEFEKAQEAKGALGSQLTKVTNSITKNREAVEKARRDMSDWQVRWEEAVSGLRLDPTADPDAVSRQLQQLATMQDIASKITVLKQDRIGKIRRDLAKFDDAVAALVNATAPDLAGLESDSAANQLELLLQEQLKLHQDFKAKRIEVSNLEDEIQALEQKRDKALEVIDRLRATAEAPDVDALRREIEKVELHTQHHQDRADAIKELAQSGDGLSVEDLTAECQGVDLDQASAREATVEDEMKSILMQRDEERDRLRKAQDAFNSMGGGDAAAKAEGERQSAIAEIREIAARYVLARAAARILHWAIDRHCQEQQGPLLQNAGRMFRSLTSKSFESLLIDYDDRNRTTLVGRRPGGEQVPTDGMSDGTVDQLYFALRIAALEQYLQHQEALPFVADDLFIHFDDDRAAAGFRVLGHLAERCQVIFFTHHEHLVDVAKATLAAPPRILRLQ